MAVQPQLCGRILDRFEQKGLQLIAAKLITISQPLAETHCGTHKGKPFYEPRLKYITSGPVIVCVFQADRAITIAAIPAIDDAEASSRRASVIFSPCKCPHKAKTPLPVPPPISPATSRTAHKPS